MIIEPDKSKMETVDAVFVIGTGSVDNNEELRYALRNLDANCKFIRDVYICGFCPKWVDKSVVKHLNWPDRFSHAKDANIIDKLRHACEHEGIAGKILFCSDDQFQTHPCEWEDFYPRYLRRFFKNDSWYEDKRRVWHTRLRKTLLRDVERRAGIGLDTRNVFYYQPHMWMQIDRDKFIEYAKWCDYEHRDDTIIASGYFNFIDADGKPDADHVFLPRCATALPNATHIAYNDGGYRSAISILKKMFPAKCRFEIGYGQAEVRETAKKETGRTNGFTGLVGSRAGDFDPSKASKEEIDEILEVSSMIRDNPVWNGLLSEMSRAEELRLFGVMGWRLVWRDLISRWREETEDGTVLVPVSSKRSDEASGIVNSYMSDPDSMRTVKFGGTPENTSRSIPSFGRQMPRTPPESVMSALRNKIRNSLRRWRK